MPEEGPEPAARLLRLPGRTLETLAHVEPHRKQLRHRAAQDNPLEGCLSNRTALAMAFKLVEGTQKTWRRLDGHNQLPKVIRGVKFTEGCEVIAKPGDLQSQTAAA
jgi:putative transposase